jgi:hypothetical protein
MSIGREIYHIINKKSGTLLDLSAKDNQTGAPKLCVSGAKLIFLIVSGWEKNEGNHQKVCMPFFSTAVHINKVFCPVGGPSFWRILLDSKRRLGQISFHRWCTTLGGKRHQSDCIYFSSPWMETHAIRRWISVSSFTRYCASHRG